MNRFLVIGAMVTCCAAGCGGSNSSTPAGSEAARGQGAAGAQTPAQVAAKSLEDLAKSAGTQQTAKAVEYAELKKLMPDVAGWEKSEVKGEQGAMMGISYSKAEGQYQKGDMSVTLEIMDTAMIQALVMPFSMMAAGGFNQKSDEGYKQGITIAGSPGWEEWENQGQSGEVSVLVGKRFVVHANGHDLPNIDAAKQIVQAVNLSRLAGLK